MLYDKKATDLSFRVLTFAVGAIFEYSSTY